MHGIHKKIKKDIEQDGWSTIAVFPTPDDPGVHFSYSVGFQEHDQPEVIVLGLPPDFAHAIIHSLYDKIVAGEKLEDGQRLDEVIEDYQVLLRAIPPGEAPVNVAKSYYEREVPALQVLWPDKEGRFPGEEGCKESIAADQDLEQLRRQDAEKQIRNSRTRWDGPVPPQIEELMKSPQMAQLMESLKKFDDKPLPLSSMNYSLPHIEGKIEDGEKIFELFRGWSEAAHLDLEQFWTDFDITGEAIRDFSVRCGMALNTTPPIIGLMMTFGAAIAKSRYRPKGQPEITI
jgi:hypothetical protein